MSNKPDADPDFIAKVWDTQSNKPKNKTEKSRRPFFVILEGEGSRVYAYLDMNGQLHFRQKGKLFGRLTAIKMSGLMGRIHRIPKLLTEERIRAIDAEILLDFLNQEILRRLG